MYKILTLNKISNKGLTLLPKERYFISNEEDNPDAILARSYQMHEMTFPKSLKAIARAGAGVNNIPLQRCSDEGIVVFNTPGANANAVKELVICSLFLASREIIKGVGWAKVLKGEDSEIESQVEKNKSRFAGSEIKGKTLGVIGLGAIGALVAKDALSLGMNVIGFDPYLSVDAAWELSNKVKKASSLEYLLKKSDFLTIHVPLLPSTKQMYNEELFNKMKNGIKIMNFSRGELFNDEDLISALDKNQVSAYVTDFPNSTLISHEKVIAIPHLGASTKESEENCAIFAASSLKEFLESGNITNSVNFPNAKLEMKPNLKRISIINKNVPNKIGEVTSILANYGLNIEDMLNQSKGEVSYMLLDIDGEISNEVIEKLKGLNDIVRVRLVGG